MGKGRWLYDNFITDAGMITLSSAATGIVGRAVSESLGGASMYAQGDYTGEDSLKYEALIDSVNAGKSIGQATFRWRTGDSETWQATGVSTSSTLITLNNGVQIKWISGTGDDFELGDRWTFLAVRHRGRTALLDKDPDSEWRATDCVDENITIDLDQERSVSALVLGHHNLTSSATITLMANGADEWSSPPFSQVLSYSYPHVAAFINNSYRYWRLRMQDATNPDGYVRASEIFLGSYFEPSINYIYGLERYTDYPRLESLSASNLRGAAATGKNEGFSMRYRFTTQEDIISFLAMMDTVHASGLGRACPIWLCPDSAVASDIIYGLPAANLPRTLARVGDHRFDLGITFNEIARRAS